MLEQKKRHGCLTATLVGMIVINSAISLMLLFAGSVIKQTFIGIPSWALVVMWFFAVFNLVCAIALFKWKKWGFWGFIFSNIVAVFFYLAIGVGIWQSLRGLIGIAILYGVLQIGGDKKGWIQLE